MNLVRAISSLRRAARRALPGGAGAAALLLAACITGGTGTDTENGLKDGNGNHDPNSLVGISARVTDSLGSPLAGVSVRLFDPAYRPDSGRAPAAVVSDPPESLKSDTGGYVRLTPEAAGKFVVEGFRDGATLFFDTLAVADPKRAAIYTFRARPSVPFRGKVKLVSGMRIDSGKVFIRGTGRSAGVAADGSYDLGPLPADAARMALGVRFASSPVAVLRAVPVPSSITDTSKRPAYTCAEVTADSARKTVTPALAGGPEPDLTSKLDSASTDSALRACDSLAKGTVIRVAGSVVGQVPANLDPSKEARLLVLDSTQATRFTSPKSLGPVVVPLAQCVPGLGTETTSFALDVEPGRASSDITVEDVAAQCLGR